MGKEAIRQRVWDELEDAGVARFPFPPHGRIPNFEGARDAAERLCSLPAWESASAVKVNPDAPQRPVRKRALEAGKLVYMAVPRLADEACFLRLDPEEITDIDHATTLGGSAEVGTPVRPCDVQDISLIVVGSVAVNRSGARIGKGEGYSDLEYGLLREVGAVSAATPVVTTVHDIQLVDDEIPVQSHDVPLDVISTPRDRYRTETEYSKPRGIDESALTPAQREAIPILDTFT